MYKSSSRAVPSREKPTSDTSRLSIRSPDTKLQEPKYFFSTLSAIWAARCPGGSPPGRRAASTVSS